MKNPILFKSVFRFPRFGRGSFLIFLACSFCLSARAQQNNSVSEQTAIEMLTHLAQYRAGATEQATLKWQHLAQDTSLIAKPSEPLLKRLAGLAFVLASYGWSELEDPRAFATWQAALEIFLDLDSYWEQEVVRQMELLGQLEKDLVSVSPQNQSLVASPITLDAELLLWQELEKHLQISKFNGPEPFQVPTQSTQGLAPEQPRPAAPIPFQMIEQAPPRSTGPGRLDDTSINPLPKSILPSRTTNAESTTDFGTETTTEIVSNDSPLLNRSESDETAGYEALSPTFLQALKDEMETDPPAGGDQSNGEQVLLEDLERRDTLSKEITSQATANELSQTISSAATQPTGLNSDPSELMPEEPQSEAFQIPPFPTTARVDLRWREPDSKAFPLSASDQEAARIAWQYITRNYQSTTGLINAVEAYPFATLWDMASGLAAIICAHGLDLISDETFSNQWQSMLTTFEQLPLYNNALPNREYNVQTAKMTDLENRISSVGSGWSAIDLGRMLVWLAILKTRAPQAENQIARLIESWDLARACRNGQLFGAFYDGQKETIRQEGRLGYEQYAAAGFSLWKFPVSVAQNLNFDSWIDIEGFVLPNDNRNLNYLTSEPFILASLEHRDMAPEFQRLTELMFLIQKQRFKRTGVLTAVSEDAIARYPWFVYNCVVFGDDAWKCVDRHGRSRPSLKSFSSKAGWAWSAIFVDEYSDLLRQKALPLNHPQKGYFSGSFENGNPNRSLNINTNAVILEAIYYKARQGRSFLNGEVSP